MAALLAAAAIGAVAAGHRGGPSAASDNVVVHGNWKIAIWDAAGAVVYDNAPGTPWDLATAVPPAITSGSIQVHH